MPVTPRDARLDLVLTEREVIDCRQERRHAHSFHRRHRWAQRARRRCSIGCRGWSPTGSSISSSSTARTPPAASASPRRSINELIDAGADAVTLGNHAWDQREALVFIERAPRLVRPVNYPAGTPGRGAAMIESARTARACWSSTRWAASSWTRSTIRSRRSSASLSACALKTGADAIIIDMHCRGHEREAGDGLFRRRPRQPRGRHAHARADRRSPHPAGRHGVHVRRRHDRRLRVGHRHEQGRAAVAFPRDAFRQASSSRRTVRRRSAASRSKPTMRPGLRGASAPVRLGGKLEQARPAFWA